MLNKKTIEKINNLLDAKKVLEKINFNIDKILEEPNGILAYCPIHGDNVIKTLFIDKIKKTFRCRYTLCPGHKGGNLVKLWALANDLSEEKAAIELVKEFNLPIEIPSEKDFFEEEYKKAYDYYNKKDYKNARLHILRALEYKPEDIKAGKLLTLIDYEEKEDTNLFARLTKLQKIAKTDEDYKELEELFNIITKKKKTSTKLIKKKIEFLDKIEQKEKLISEFFSLAEIYENRREYNKAIRVYKEIINIEPTNKKAKDKLAKVYLLQQDKDETIDTFFKMYEKHMDMKNMDAAIQDLEEIIAIDENNAMAYEELSNLYILKGKKKKACEIRLKYAERLYEDYEIFESLQYASDALSLDPQNEKIYLFLAKIYLENNISSKKANHYLFTAAKICFQKRKYKEALKYAEKISAESKENIDVLKLLIKIYIKLKKEKMVVFYAFKLIDKYVGMGKYDKAKIIFENIMKIFPKNKELKEKYKFFKDLYDL